jgi:Prokaryotic E2 family E
MALDELHKHAEELTQHAGIPVEVQEEGTQRFVILGGLVLPPVYAVTTTDVLFITDSQYPVSAMDMFWTELSVLLPGGVIPASAEVIESYCGRQWRRFSWHRNGIWNMQGNPLLDHFEFMQARFAKDVTP